MNSDMQPYLQSSPVVDCHNRAIVEFAKENAGDSTDRSEQAVRLYYAVRDGIRYDPYSIDLSNEGLRASTTLHSGRGWCVAKAILLLSGGLDTFSVLPKFFKDTLAIRPAQGGNIVH